MSDRKHDRTSSAIEAGLYLDWTKDNLLKPAFSSTSMYHEEIEGSSEYKYGIYISMAEVYNDKVFDLFEETGIGKRRTPLSVNTDPITRKTFLGGVTKIFVSNAQEAYRLLEKGQKLRSCHSTGSNSTSSRSHAFTCIEIKRQSANGQGDLKCSQMTIVDLAGTERNKLAKTAGNRLQESCAINQSLMLLGQCLQLQRGEEKKHNRYSKEGMNEFRSCKLTHILLSNAFLPNSTQKSAMLVTVDPFGDPNSITQIFRYSAAAQEIPEPPPTPSRISTAIKQTTPSRNPTGIKRNTPTKSVPGIRAGEITAQRTLLSVPAKSRVSSTSSNSTHSSFTLADIDRRLSEEHSDCDADDEKYDFHSSTETLLERIAILEDLLEKSEQKCQDIEDEIRLEMADEMDERMEQLKEQFLDDRDSEATRGQEHIDRKIKIAVDSIQGKLLQTFFFCSISLLNGIFTFHFNLTNMKILDAERTAANSKISHLEETIEAIMRENRALKEQNEKLQSAVARGGSAMEFELHDNENGVAGMKKKKRLRTAKPVSFDDTDFSDE